jgi:hypothetical protein
VGGILLKGSVRQTVEDRSFCDGLIVDYDFLNLDSHELSRPRALNLDSHELSRPRAYVVSEMRELRHR